MRINLKSTLIFFFLNTCLAAFSQITVSDVDTKKGQNLIVEKPAPFDSLKTWEYFYNPVQYKRYIGQRVYLPKSNQKFSVKKPIDGYGTLKIGDFNSAEAPFLFTLKLNTTQFNSLNVLSNDMLNIKYAPGNITGYNLIFNLDSAVTRVYMPFLYYLSINSYSNKYYFSIGNNPNIGNQYFQIIDVVYGENLHKMMNFRSTDLGSNDGMIFFSETQNIGKKTQVTEKTKSTGVAWQRNTVAYLLKDEVSKDTVLYYENGRNRFILVSYFVKQKEIYEGEYIINKSYSFETKGIKVGKNSKWLCKSVTVSAFRGYLIYVLENEIGDILTRSDINGFVLEEVVLKEEAEKKMLAQEREEKHKKEEQQRKEKERLAVEKRKATCIEKFGQERGKLIAQGKVQIGMTKEMCEMAWGKPIMINKTTSEYGISETWHFGFIKALYFKDDILKRFDE